MEIFAFQRCSPVIAENLKIEIILPHLIEQEMLNDQEIQIMYDCFHTESKRIKYLASVLPDNGVGFLSKFMLSLSLSQFETGHRNILKSLTTTLNEIKQAAVLPELSECIQQTEEGKWILHCNILCIICYHILLHTYLPTVLFKSIVNDIIQH